jgi:glycosyltransferase involved in cell wall biosynthesis
MRIIYIHQYYRRPDQGGAIRSYHLTRGLAKEGIEVEVITAHNEKSYKLAIDGKVKVHYLAVPYNSGFSNLERAHAFYKFYKRALKLIKDLPSPDLFYISSTPISTGWIGTWAKKTLGVPYVFEVRDLWPEAPFQVLQIKNPVIKKLFYRMEAKIYEEAEKIVALSPGIQSYIQQIFPNKKVELIPNFSDTSFFVPKKRGVETRNFAKQPLTLLYSGAIGKVNGLDQYLELALEANKQDKNWRFELMGSGNELKKLKKKASRMNLRNVYFIPFGDKISVKMQLGNADFAYISFLPLSVLENSSPNKFFDALSMGLPVIVNFKGWIHDLIVRNEIGFIHNPDNNSILIQKLENLEKNPQPINQMGLRSRKLAETYFDKREAQQKLLALLDRRCQQELS